MGVNVIGPAKHGLTLLDGVISSNIDPGVEEMILGGDGSVYNTFIAAGESMPMASIETLKISAWLNHIGVTGLSIGANPFEMYFAETDLYSSRLLTGEKVNIPQGIILPRTISASQGNNPATLSVDIIMVAEGVNKPFAISSDQTVPTGTSISEAFGLGGVTVGGVAVNHVQNVSINFGAEEVKISSNGDLEPSYCYIRRYSPSITISSLDAKQLASLSALGNQATVSVVLRKREDDGFAGAGDLTFSTTLSRAKVTSLSGTHDGEASTALTVSTAYDGVNHPITLS